MVLGLLKWLVVQPRGVCVCVVSYISASDCFNWHWFSFDTLLLTKFIIGGVGVSNPGEGEHLVSWKSVCIVSTLSIVHSEDVRHDKQHRLNCLQLPGDTISSVPPASGVVSPPELPAWISRQPACLSWPTESYLIPENLSIKSRVTRPTDRGHTSGPLMNFTGAHTEDMGFTPGIKSVKWDRCVAFQSWGVNSSTTWDI